MSKNNQKEVLRKMQPQRPHYGLRKLTIGVASVLLGITFLAGGSVAHASAPTTTTADQNTPTTTQVSNNSQATTNKTATLTQTQANNNNATQPVNNNAKSANTNTQVNTNAQPANTNNEQTTTFNVAKQANNGNVDPSTIITNLSEGTDADQYQPVYNSIEIYPYEQTTLAPTWSTSDGNLGKPSSATFSAIKQTPKWMQVANDGTLTFHVADNLQTQLNIPEPVLVTYGDGSTETVNVTVTVGENQPGLSIGYKTYTHKTSSGSASAPIEANKNMLYKIYYQNGTGTYPSKVINSVTYELNADGTKYVAVTPITDSYNRPIKIYNPNQLTSVDAPKEINADDVLSSISWFKTLDTDISNYNNGTATTKDLFKSHQSHQYKLQLPMVNISYQTSFANTFDASIPVSNVNADVYGAVTGSPLTFYQGTDISNLSQSQYRTLINVSDLGASGWGGTNVNPDAPVVLSYMPGSDNSKTFYMTWAPDGQPSTAEVANGVAGTVRIYFNDGTWLDVPATINVIAKSKNPENQTFTQKIVYTYNGHEVAQTSIDNIKKGSSVTANTLKSTIDDNVPGNYTIKSGFTYPSALQNVTSAPATIYVPLDLTSPSAFDATGKIQYRKVDGTKFANGQKMIDGTSIKSNIGDTITAAVLKDYTDQGMNTISALHNYVVATYPVSYKVSEDGFVITVLVKDQTEKVTQSKDVTQTIHYVYSHGKGTAKPDNVQTLTFKENGIHDLVTGDTTWTPAASQSYSAVTSPSITGYTPSQTTIPASSANYDSSSSEITVTYYQNAQTAGITYFDDTDNKLLETGSASGFFSDPIEFANKPANRIAYYEGLGYVLVSNNFNGQTYQANNKKNQFTVHFKHGTETITRDSEVTQTIHYVMDDGSKAPADNVQTLKFHENGIRDKVNGHEAWTPALDHSFTAVTSPKVTNYVPDKTVVPGSSANFNTPSSRIVVTYKKSIPWTPLQPSKPVNPSKPVKTIPWTPLQPSKPVNTSKPGKTIPWTPLQPSKPVNPSKPGKTIPWTPLTPSKPVNPSKPGKTIPWTPLTPAHKSGETTIPWTPLTPSKSGTSTNPSQPTNPTNPSNPGTTTNPGTSTKPGTSTTTGKSTATTPGATTTPSTPSATKTPKSTTTPSTSVTSTETSATPNASSATQTFATPNATVAAEKTALSNSGVAPQSQTAAKKLPQTGDSNESALVALGLGSVAALLGLAGKKRKED